jgi:hypothetical protein
MLKSSLLMLQTAREVCRASIAATAAACLVYGSSTGVFSAAVAAAATAAKCTAHPLPCIPCCSTAPDARALTATNPKPKLILQVCWCHWNAKEQYALHAMFAVWYLLKHLLQAAAAS